MLTDDHHPWWWEFARIEFYPLTIDTIFASVVLIVLLISSALVSGAEVAFFSLSSSYKKKLEKDKDNKNFKRVLSLLDIPEKLLATILIANNFINIGIIILFSFVFSNFINFNDFEAFEFVFKVVIITFLILLFGEIIPKVFASQYPLKFACFMSLPLYISEKLFRPLAKLMVLITSSLQRKFKSYNKNISIKDLSHAIDLAAEEIVEEKEMLESIVKFSSIEIQEIMCPRVNVEAVDIEISFSSLKATIVDSGFSRIPVFKNNLDNIKGIIHVKDLIPYVQSNILEWSKLIRKPYFVPEHKKINELLVEFKSNKNHIAIAVDEYGGTSGIITMEDILEEIVGEIYDESDIDEKYFEQLDENTYFFIGKVQLNDFYKILNIPKTSFEYIKGDADSLAGLLLEIKKSLPHKGEQINYKNFTFIVESVDKKRIKKIKVIKKHVFEKR